MNKQIKRIYPFLWRFVVGIVILLFLLYKLDFRKVYEAVLKVNIWIILIICFYAFLLILINTFIFDVLLRSLKKRVKFSDLFKYYAKAWSIGRFFPGRLGEFSIVYYLKKEKIPYGKGSVLALINKLATLITLGAISICGFFLFLSKEQAIKLTLLSLGLIVLICIFLFSRRIKGVIKKYILRKYASKFKGFSKYLLYFIGKKKKVLSVVFLISFARAVVAATTVAMLFWLYGVKVSLFMVIIINSLGVLAALLPISASGLGIKEATVVYFYSLLGVDPVITGTIYLLIRVVHYVIAGIIDLI